MDAPWGRVSTGQVSCQLSDAGTLDLDLRTTSKLSCWKTMYSISLRFNSHFPGEPELAGVYWKQRMMEVVVTTGAKLQSNHHHQQTNIQFFLQAGCPSCCPTNSVSTEVKSHGLAYPKLTWGLPTLSLTTNSSWVTLGEGCRASHQPSDASTPGNWENYVLLPIINCLQPAILTWQNQTGEKNAIVASYWGGWVKISRTNLFLPGDIGLCLSGVRYRRSGVLLRSALWRSKERWSKATLSRDPSRSRCERDRSMSLSAWRELGDFLSKEHANLVLIILLARRDSIEPNRYGNMAGWLAGCLSQPVLYQND